MQNHTLPIEPGFFGCRLARAAATPRLRPLTFEADRGAAGARVTAGFLARALAASEVEAQEIVERAATTTLTPEHRLLLRATFGPAAADFERIHRLGYKAWLDEQLAWEAIDDSALDAVLAEHLPTLAKSPAELYFYFPDRYDEPIRELQLAVLYRALYSRRQLYERMVAFWSDHFNMDAYGDTGWFLLPVDQREVVRAHALGKFPDLLRASAHSPAMLAYLTNDSNYAGHPNENYAREIMELHTLGADNGYTQEDVREVARCFTGWAYEYDETSPELGRFRFHPDWHDDGEKRVLGETIPAGGGQGDGERVLDLLGAHPNTARFIGRKLARSFWGYDPPEALLDRLAWAYSRTGGEIRAMLRVVLSYGWMAEATPKLKRPQHYLVSMLRAIGAATEDPGWLLDALYAAGHAPFTWSPPNGFPDARGFWAGLLLWRFNAPVDLVDESISGARFDLSWLDPRWSPQALVNVLDWLVANRTLSPTTRGELRAYLRGGSRTPRRLREALALAFTSPELQDY